MCDRGFLLAQKRSEQTAAIATASFGSLEFQHSEKERYLLWSLAGVDQSTERAKVSSKMPCHQHGAFPFLLFRKSSFILRCNSIFELVDKKFESLILGAQEEKWKPNKDNENY